jgi:methyl-accepting chemotaxis protein
VVQQNAAASEEMASTSADLAEQAHGLEQLVAFFKVQGGSAPAARTVARVSRPSRTALPEAAVQASPAAPRGLDMDMDEPGGAEFERF